VNHNTISYLGIMVVSSNKPIFWDDISMKRRIARKNDIVTVEFKLEPNGFVTEPLFDTQGIVSFVLGGGNYLPGLHDLIENMSVGDNITDVSIDSGWGEPNPALVAKVSKEGQPSSGGLEYEKVKVGTELMLQNGINCIVTEVTDNYFVIDANPPLAGTSYNCQLTLLQVESFPNDKLDYAKNNDVGDNTGRYQVATFALGCFWGSELMFMRERGVVGTKVGYTQGNVPNPTYKDVCSGDTGHTEAVQVVYDSTVVSFERLVTMAVNRLGDSIFLLDQVGNDVGTQYRHGIYYHSDEQRYVAERLLKRMRDYKTEIKPAGIFYNAEDYHQQYLLKGGQSAKKGTKEYIRCYG